MSSYLESLASFVPQLILRRANQDPKGITAATVVRFPAAVLFADISGFTALTERLASRGAAGAEDLTVLLNRYFGQMIDLIGEHGGDVVKFAGDALVALWPSPDEAGVADRVERVARCSLAMQGRLHDYEVAEGLRLSMKLAIGAGEVLSEHLGGVFDRWELLIAGQPLAQVGVANGRAEPGDIVVSAEAWPLIADRANGVALDNGAVRLSSLERTLAVEPPTALALRPEIAPGIRSFVPVAIRGRLDAGHTDWLGELRRISLMFVNLPDFNVDAPLVAAQAAMRALQTALYRFEGSINKISVDDKGASLIAVLGLPPLSHEDDPERALRAAVAMQEGLTEIGFGSSVGICTGLAFCGAVGNARRREYTVMGDVVNLAARLMQAARGDILCDKATAAAAGHRVRLEELPAIKVKGKALPVEVWRPVSSDVDRTERKPAKREIHVIGRQAECAAMAERLESLRRKGAGSRVFLEAEVGMGKASLLREFLGLAEDRGILGLMGAGDAIEMTIPYRAWRRVFASLYPIDPALTDPGARRTNLAALLPADPKLIELTPLIEAVLPMQWADNEVTRALSGKARAQKTQDLLVALLQAAAREKPLLVIIRDVAWLDSASWSVLMRVAREVERLLLVATSRPVGADPLADFAKLLALPGIERVELPPLSDDDIGAVVRNRLGVDQLPEAVQRLVQERSEGNPMFAEELALGLRDNGVLEIAGRECRLVGSADELSATKLPNTLGGVITGRIDRLGPAEQITLKVASVVGRVFDPGMLADIYPIASARAEVASHCDVLERLELTPSFGGRTPLQASPDGKTYIFKSKLTQEIAYGLMLFSQRRELHQKIAQWLEAHADTTQADVVTLLARHWRMAAEDRVPHPELVERAAGYYEKAAKHAMRAFANREAIDLLQQAIAMARTLPESPAATAIELRLQLELGPALVAATSYGAPEVQAVYDRARELCRHGGDPGQLFRALRGVWQFQVGQSKYELARATAQEMLALAAKAQDAALLIEAHRVTGNVAFWTGDFAMACVEMERAVALYDPQRHQALAVELGQDPDVANRGILSWALCYLGRPLAAEQHMRVAVERAETLGHPFSRAFAGGTAMWSAWFLDQPDHAERRAAQMRDLSLERGFPYLAAAAKVVHGWAAARNGQLDRGLAEIEEAIGAWRATGASIGMVIFLQALAEVQILAGRASQALATLDDPIIVDRIGVEGWRQGDQARLRGEAFAALGKSDAAATALLECEAIATRQGARLTALRALTTLCELNTRDHPAQRERLRDALAAFPEPADISPVLRARRALQVFQS
jgi:predicted ATPase/class 3 adenylate cyclase